ncbi:hypothetical protein [Corynebacterium sp. A21]|uniref:hypothetical protein n=1 Tax=Corynebacterium sp. A21 TaxID=3457318 RepID=UPI003FD13722
MLFGLICFGAVVFGKPCVTHALGTPELPAAKVSAPPLADPRDFSDLLEVGAGKVA